MDIQDIFDRILLRSGQYIIRKSKIDMDVDTFRMLVEDALSDYSGSVPFISEYTLNLNNQRSFTFPLDFDDELKRAPDWLSEVTPIASFGSYHTVFGHRSGQGLIPDTIAVDPIEAPWDYNDRTRVLTVPFSAHYKIVGVFKHIIVETEDATTGKPVFDIPTISIDDQPFFLLLQGMFLQGIGRSRRAFTLSDLPIIMDADQLVADGVELVAQYEQAINDDFKFYLAYGG